MNSIMLSIVTRTAQFFSQLSAEMHQQQVAWFTNPSGRSSFRADVVQDRDGFTAIISRRTRGSSYHWRYQQLTKTQHFASPRKALREGRRFAKQLADLRYRFD